MDTPTFLEKPILMGERQPAGPLRVADRGACHTHSTTEPGKIKKDGPHWPVFFISRQLSLACVDPENLVQGTEAGNGGYDQNHAHHIESYGKPIGVQQESCRNQRDSRDRPDDPVNAAFIFYHIFEKLFIYFPQF